MIKKEATPVHRKTIIPWYDSESVCLVMIAFMLAVFWFGITGIAVAKKSAGSPYDIWVPCFLTAASSLVIISTTLRLIKRYLATRIKDFQRKR